MARVGPGVDSELIGRRVLTSLGGSGGYAERAVADTGGLIDLPDQLKMKDAVALLADGRTAMLLVRAAPDSGGRDRAGRSGGWRRGSLLVQFACSTGARVVGPVGSQQKLDCARKLGASLVVNYADAAWADQLRREVGQVDVVFDGVGGTIGVAAFQLLCPGGRFSAFGMASGSFAPVSEEDAVARDVSLIRGGRSTPGELRDLAQLALTEAVAGRLQPVIGQSYPLERAADAHAAIEGRATIGKTLLTRM